MTPPGTTAEAVAAPAAVRLSEVVRVTITISGPAPLVVNPPENVSAGPGWTARPAGDAFLLRQPGGREKWVRDYHFDPDTVGPAVPLAVKSFDVTSGGVPGRVSFPRTTVAVRTVIADGAAPRPLAAVEPLPDPPAAAVPAWPFAVTLAAVAVVAVRRFTRPRPAAAAKGLAEVDAADPVAVAEAVASAVRTKLNAPAYRTTAELLASTPAAAVFAGVLHWCDAVKFAGARPTADECRAALAAAGSAPSGGITAAP